MAFLEGNVASELEVVVGPRITVIEREGITGGGCPVKVGNRVLSFYPNHPDDFGGSKGMGSAISTDGGMTWTEVPFGILNSGSSVAVLRLRSGNWILAVNDTARGRYQLSLYLSQDEGKTWTRKRYLEQLDPTEGSKTAGYPTLIQSTDDLIHVTYTYTNEPTHQGRTIKHAWFNETWIINGNAH